VPARPATDAPGFTAVADGVHVLRHPVLDVNVTLIVGGEAALVVDTLSTAGQARLLREAVRSVTTLPLRAVNTHHHFDHCFGNDTLAPTVIHAHPEAAALIARTDPATVYRAWGTYHPDLAGVRDVRIRVPDALVPTRSTVDLGGRTVDLCHLGRGHTAGDLVVHVPDAGVVVAGDLVEESGPPSFDDAYPLEWPETLVGVLALSAGTVVPGHGAVCDAAFVRAQHADLAALEWLIRDGHADGAPADTVAKLAPFPTAAGIAAAAIAVARGYAELDGTI
jgi:glyoxylase-like metal-dependent hydrolase (beta-lactamase superfamily II)